MLWNFCASFLHLYIMYAWIWQQNNDSYIKRSYFFCICPKTYKWFIYAKVLGCNIWYFRCNLSSKGTWKKIADPDKWMSITKDTSTKKKQGPDRISRQVFLSKTTWKSSARLATCLVLSALKRTFHFILSSRPVQVFICPLLKGPDQKTGFMWRDWNQTLHSESPLRGHTGALEWADAWL